jgi:hypothetical protein
MGLARLQLLAESFSSAPPNEFAELARTCDELAVNRADARFAVLARCFRQSDSCWGQGEAGAVTADFASALTRIWDAYLPGVLGADTVEEGTQLASALSEELAILGQHDPLTY